MSEANAARATIARKIVCGLDLEGRAQAAAAMSVWLAERLQAELEFVHAFPLRPILWGKYREMPEWVAGTESAGRALRAALRDSLARWSGPLGLTTSPDALRVHVKSGHAAHVLLDRARDIGAELVVLGSHAKRGKLDFGSTARGVLPHAPHAVWQQPSAPKVVRAILVPVDLSPDSLHALERARDLALLFGARITVMQAFTPPALGAYSDEAEPVGPTYAVEHVSRDQRERFESTVETFDWRGVAHDARFEEGEPAERILAAGASHDLIVMGTHGHTGFSAAVLGGVAYSVLRATTIPVLALRHSQTFLI